MNIMTTSKELYKMLSADFNIEEKFDFDDLGEGMMQAWEKGSRRVFLINTTAQDAWELLTAHGRFSYWNRSAVEIADTFDLPYKPQRNAVELRAPYYFGIDKFKDGVASVTWSLQRQSKYSPDGDGFDIKPEIEFTAFINTSANILIPFQSMDNTLKELYRVQAVTILKEHISYVCLSDKMTIPFEENVNLDAHKEKLLKVVYGMMVQFGSLAANAYKNEKNRCFFGISTAINPTPEHHLSLSLLAHRSKGDKYKIILLTAFFQDSEISKSLKIVLDDYDADKIEDFMNAESQVEVFYEGFVDMAKELLEQ